MLLINSNDSSQKKKKPLYSSLYDAPLFRDKHRLTEHNTTLELCSNEKHRGATAPTHQTSVDVQLSVAKLQKQVARRSFHFPRVCLFYGLAHARTRSWLNATRPRLGRRRASPRSVYLRPLPSDVPPKPDTFLASVDNTQGNVRCALARCDAVVS